MRYIQHPITHKLIPADEYVRPQNLSHAIHGDIEPFVSPVDGSVISDRKQLAEHNRRNNVVNAAEFTPEFYAEAAEKRRKVFANERTPAKIREDRMAIHEAITRYERANR